MTRRRRDRLRVHLRRLLRVDRRQLTPGAGLRCAGGVVAVLVIGISTGFVADGVSAAVGALSVGIASLQGAYRRRARVMLAASAGMALSAFVGAAVAGHPGLSVAMTVAWALVAGLLVAFGPAAAVVGLQGAVALIVFGQFPQTLSQAAVRALLVLAGGLGQTVLAVAFWPLRLHLAERTALADVLDALAGYARGGVSGGVGLPAGEPLAAAAAVVADVNPLEPGRDRMPFRALLDEAERLRVQLAGLTRERDLAEPADGAVAAAALRAAAGRLAVAADRLRPSLTPGGRPVGWWPGAQWPGLRWRPSGPGPRRGGTDETAATASDAAAVASAPEGASASAGADGAVAGTRDREGPDALAAAPALAGQLRAVERLVAGVEGSDSRRPPGPLIPPPATALDRPGPVLRANLRWDSEAFRHALRLAAVLAVASVLYRVLPLQRGYWVALTALVVLKPDFATTVVNGVGRILGTAVGAVAFTALAAEVRPGRYALVVLVGVLVAAGVSVLRANYTLFAVLLTGYVVFLLGLVGLPPHGAAVDRLVDTAVGGGLALAAYLAWPSWEGGHTADRLAESVDALRGYAVTVLRAYADPSLRRDPRQLHAAQLTARRIRLAAEASVERVLAEPAAARLDPELAASVIAALRRFAHAALWLHAVLPPDPVTAIPACAVLADALDAELTPLAGALRRGRPPAAAGPRLRTFQQAVAGAAPPDAVAAADELVDAVNTVADLLSGSAARAAAAVAAS